MIQFSHRDVLLFCFSTKSDKHTTWFSHGPLSEWGVHALTTFISLSSHALLGPHDRRLLHVGPLNGISFGDSLVVTNVNRIFPNDKIFRAQRVNKLYIVYRFFWHVSILINFDAVPLAYTRVVNEIATHICVSKLGHQISSDNGLSLVRR